MTDEEALMKAVNLLASLHHAGRLVLRSEREAFDEIYIHVLPRILKRNMAMIERELHEAE